MDKRIRLAEAMGWKCVELDDGTIYWHSPNMLKGCGQKNPPDPENNANDCEALIRYLNERGHPVVVDWQRVEALMAWVCVYGAGCDTFDDWKQGVCELALQVLDPCAGGHDFRDLARGGTALCHDCGELADCAETGAALQVLDTDEEG